MSLEKLAIGVIGNGMAVPKIDEAIDKVVADVLARPGVKKARTVSVTLEFAPAGQDGDQVMVDWKVGTTMPGVRGASTTAMRARDGSVVVSTLDPNVLQSRIEEIPGVVAANVTPIRAEKV